MQNIQLRISCLAWVGLKQNQLACPLHVQPQWKVRVSGDAGVIGITFGS